MTFTPNTADDPRDQRWTPPETPPPSIDVPLTIRNAELGDLAAMLTKQQDVKYDVVAHSDKLRYDQGHLVIGDGTSSFSDIGGNVADAYLRPLKAFEDSLANRFKIPRQYLQRMRDEDAIGLLDDNVNHWLRESDKNWLVRGFLNYGEDEIGIARAFLSDRYSVIDNMDTLTAALDGVRKSGVDATVGHCNLTEKSMYVELEAPAVRATAPDLIGDYRSPWNGQSGDELPIVHAGFVLRNSETGGGAFSIVPRIVFEICGNGMTITKEAMRKVHLGGRMEEGAIAWSDETRHHYIELVKNQTIDAVRLFLSGDYLAETVEKLTVHATTRLTDPLKAVEQVTTSLGYSETDREGILSLFVKGGDLRAMGVASAMTAYAQEVDDADKAAELEDDAFGALVAAAKIG